MTGLVLALLVVTRCFAAAPAAEDGRFLTPREIVAAVDTNFIERLAAPRAVDLAVSEPARVVVVSHAAGVGRHLSLFGLDASGRPATGAPAVIILPKPASLAAYDNVVAGLAAHPTRPLLYVWQDLATDGKPPLGKPEQNPVFNDLDRLLVYRLDGTNAQLAATWRSGACWYGPFHDGIQSTPLGLDAIHRRLYLPNLRDPRLTSTVQPALGCLELDEEGLPVKLDGRIAPPRIQGAFGGTLPIGLGWVPATADRVLFGWHSGIGTWDLANRRAPVTFKTDGALDWAAQLVGHPALPLVYRTCPTAAGVVSAQGLADGYPTLLPQRIALSAVHGLQVLTKRHQLAAGRITQVLLIDLDAEGWLTPGVSAIDLPGFSGTALAYSATWDRLYVAVEKRP